MTPYLIGIVGGSGSGKSYTLNKLLDRLGSEHVAVVAQDNYYKPMEVQPKDPQGIQNFDLPESMDFDALVSDISGLLEGKTIRRLEYGFNNPDKEDKWLVVEPRPIVIIEGIYVFHDKRIDERLDCRVFVDANYPVMIRRRVLRDFKERGYNLDDVLYRYENHVMPAYEKYIVPLRSTADIVIPNNGSLDVALDVLSNHLKAQLA
ncbi:MAG: uridine kinase [Bacteroidota bacterium]